MRWYGVFVPSNWPIPLKIELKNIHINITNTETSPTHSHQHRGFNSIKVEDMCPTADNEYENLWQCWSFTQGLCVCGKAYISKPEFLKEETKCISQHIGKKQMISEFRRTNPQELKFWSTFCVNYFLKYYLMMQPQPIVKRVNGTHEWTHRPYQLLSAPYHCCLQNTGGKMKDSHSRAADRCPCVPRYS